MSDHMTEGYYLRNSGWTHQPKDRSPGVDPKKSARIKFIGFYETFNPVDNLILTLLRPYFNVVVDVRSPEIVFYSVFGNPREIKDSCYDDCTKIFVTEENVDRGDLRPRRLGNYDECDYAVTTAYSDDPRHCRLPMVYVQYLAYWRDYWNGYWRNREGGPGLFKPADYDPGKILRSKTKFCNFVYSNPGCPERNNFFEALSKYKRVDAGGRALNNLGYQVSHKVRFLEDYKFTISFENSSAPGYVSEKIFEPMVANSLPIYWGNPWIADDFNPKSFLDVTGLSVGDAVERVVALDRNDDAYLELLSEPWFAGNRPNNYCQPDYLRPFFDMVLSRRGIP